VISIKLGLCPQCKVRHCVARVNPEGDEVVLFERCATCMLTNLLKTLDKPKPLSGPRQRKVK
jgi:hypothetical protein